METHLAVSEAELVRVRHTPAVPTTVEDKHFDFGNAMPQVGVGSKVVGGKMEAVWKHVAAGEMAAAGEKVAAGGKAAAKIGDKVADGIHPLGTQAGSSFVMTRALSNTNRRRSHCLEAPVDQLLTKYGQLAFKKVSRKWPWRLLKVAWMSASAVSRTI